MDDENEYDGIPQIAGMLTDGMEGIRGVVSFTHSVLENDEAWTAAAPAAIDLKRLALAGYTLEEMREAMLANVHGMMLQLMAMEQLGRTIAAETMPIDVPDYPEDLAG